MDSISIHQNLRPIRYAFVINQGDQAAFLRSASVNTVLWGGIFNPIVPLGDRFNSQGLLNAFDPDFLVNLTGNILDERIVKAFSRRILKWEDLVGSQESRERRRLKLGFGMSDVLRYIRGAEFREDLESSRVTMVTVFPDEWEAYVATSFGSFRHLSGDTNDSAKAYEAVGAKTLTFDPLASIDYGDRLFPLEITAYGLRTLGRASNFSSHIVYVGDPASIDDLVEYWNIRATGRQTWFAPKDGFAAHAQMVSRLIKSGQDALNPKVKNHADIQKGPSISLEDLQRVVDWVSTLNSGKCVIRDWRPRFGEILERYVGDIHVADLQGITFTDISLLSDNRLTPVRLVDPPYLDDETVFGDQHWAVDLEITNPYDVDELMCELPRAPGAQEMAGELVLGGEIGVTRLGKNGVVLVVNHARSYAYPSPLKTTEVFKSIFESATGLEARISPPGKYAEQIIRKMGSLQFGCNLFRYAGVREIIQKMSRGSTLTKGNMAEIINRAAQLDHPVGIGKEHGRGVEISAIFGQLLDKRVVRPGLQFSCASCSASHWYHISEFSEEYVCRYCFERQRVKFDAAGVREWSYKADGLFQIRDSAQGSIAAIVALWRLHHTNRSISGGRYCTGIELYRGGNREVEVDYCYVEVERFSREYVMVLGEAKSFTDIEAEQVARLKALAEQFQQKPYLAFATLKDAFSDTEKQLLRSLVDDGYKVIPMTRLELDPYDLYDRFDGTRYKYLSGFSDLSAACISVNLE